MGRKILAGIIGVVVTFFTIWLVQQVGHMIYEPPTGFDFSNKEEMAAVIAAQPLGAFLFVIASYCIGTLDGVFIACKIAGERRFVYALINGGLVLLGTAFNVSMFPHPLWFTITAVAGVIISAWMGLKLSGGALPEAK